MTSVAYFLIRCILLYYNFTISIISLIKVLVVAVILAGFVKICLSSKLDTTSDRLSMILLAGDYCQEVSLC